MTFRSQHRRPQRAGFTLTELLVATALTVLVMTMFAQIYGAAVGSLRKQRSLARNDQAARKLSGILHNDLEYRTMRQPSPQYGNVRGIVPLSYGDGPIVDPDRQRGYLYISENNTGIDDDDVLQLTVHVRNNKSSQWPFVGRATSVGGVNIGQDSNPETDDGILNDGIGVSTAAEVVYFVRNGNLYRRVLLLRDPLPAEPLLSGQPTNGVDPVFSPATQQDYTVRPFFEHFDFAATRKVFPVSAGNPTYLWFHDLASLNNRDEANTPIARTVSRYGVNWNTGFPVEYDNATTPNFMGRFTAQESSSVAFKYPGEFDPSLGSTDPFLNDPARLTEDTDGDGALDNYEDGIRVGEDILLTNVEAFDVKLLDENAAGAFVDIGSTAAVDFASTRNRNLLYVNPGFGNIFDTWHPTANNTVGTTQLGSGGTPFTYPPYRPVKFRFPTTSPIVAGDAQTAEFWESSTAYVLHDKIPVPTLTDEPNQYNAFPAMYYEVVGVSGTGISDSDPNYYLSAFPPLPGNLVQDGELTWKCVDNRVGLQAIRITIRFRDTVTDVPRQVTITHSFVE